MAQYQELQASNVRMSLVWVSIMAGLTVAVGYVFGLVIAGGRMEGAILGLGIAGVLAIIQALVAWFAGAKIALAISGAREVQPNDPRYRQLINIVEEMRIASGLPMPKVHVIDDPSPNAFATGRNPEDSHVAVTTGLLEVLDREELQGVIAHEMAHIKNRDILFQTVVGIMVGMIAILSDIAVRMLFFGGGRSSNDRNGQAQIIMLIVGILFIILAPIIAQLVRFAISRQREYLADASGAQFTRNPAGLASALQKISSAPVHLNRRTHGTAHMWIADPYRVGLQANASGAFSTHPPIQKRIERLLGIGYSSGRDMQ